MKRMITGTFCLALCLGMVLPAYASSGSGLPSKFTYVVEKINLSVFTFRASSKIKTFGRYANERVNNVQTVYTAGDFNQIKDYVDKYAQLKSSELLLVEDKKITGELLETLKLTTTQQQKTLSLVRDGLEDASIKQSITKVQEDIVNKSKSTITDVENGASADKFVDGVVTAWEDPQGLKGETSYASGTVAGEATHTYAAGTTAGGVDGVVVDGGQAKVTQDASGNVKIVYASGTGPSTTTSSSGKAVWVIKNSDGSTSEGSGSAGNVVQGSSGTSSSNSSGNTVVEGGGQSGANAGGANTVVGQ